MTLADEIAAASPPPDSRTLSAIADLLARNGITVEEIGRVNRVNVWQAMSKGDDGEPTVTDLVGVQLSPAWEDGPKWPLIAPAAPCVVKARPAKPQRTSDLRTAVILPDPQFGYRRDIDTGELDPFHDEAALACALTLVRYVNPDVVILLGDTLDLAEMGRFRLEAPFVQTTQAALNRAHRFLAEVRANAPHAEIRMLEGNHDRRLLNYITDNARAAFGLRQASPTPGDWPVMSVPHLLRLDSLGVQYVEGWPAGVTWLNDRLACVHGERLKVSQVVDDERVSVIQGHIHRIELQHKTRRVRDGYRTTLAASPGCLCRIDGAVPSTKGSTDSMGRPVMRAEDWQHGVGVAHFTPGDGPFHVELVPIHDGTAIYHGRVFGGESCSS